MRARTTRLCSWSSRGRTRRPYVGEKQTDPTHSAVAGLMLLEKLRSLRVESELRYLNDGKTGNADVQEFLRQRLK